MMSEQTGQPKPSGKEEFIRLVKYCVVAASAGIVQFGTFELMSRLVFHDLEGDYGPSYFIALVASVVWNFTVNRKFTFQSANNIPKAMLLVFAYYLVFTPLSVWGGIRFVTPYIGHARYALIERLVLFVTMFINGVTEFLYQRFVVFRKTINTNDLAAKRAAKQEKEQA